MGLVVFCPGTGLQARPVFRTPDSSGAGPQPLKHPADSTHLLSGCDFKTAALSLPICQQDSYSRSEGLAIRNSHSNSLFLDTCIATISMT